VELTPFIALLRLGWITHLPLPSVGDSLQFAGYLAASFDQPVPPWVSKPDLLASRDGRTPDEQKHRARDEP